MPGWRSSVSSGPLASLRSNVTATAWSSQRQRNGRHGENDEHSLMGHPGRARLPLPLGRGIQGVQVRPAREPHARALARRMARARRARDGGRGPAGRPGRRPLDAGADPARRRRARPGNPGPRPAVRALLAQTRRQQPDGPGGWCALGVLEMVGAVLLVVPAAAHWMPVLTPLAAAALALETLALAGLYARYSLKLAATNPTVWAVVMGLLSALVAYGRYA